MRNARFSWFDILVILMAVVLFVGVASWLLFANREVATAAAAFDHSVCQYPARSTNPPDGCDNTDPACPAEIKGGSCTKDEPTPVFGAPVAPAPLETVNPQKTVEAPHCTE